MKNKTPLYATVLFAVLLIVPSAVFGQEADKKARVAEFKQSVQKSMAALRKYEWIETTTVLYKGEVKSKKQNRVYYGADGKLQKIPIEQAAPQQQQEQSSGRRGGRLKAAVVANKKEEMTEYMQQAVALLHKYVPPDPALIQYEKQAGKIKVEPVDPKTIRLNFFDFVVPGDQFAATLNIASNSIAGLNITTHLESPEDVVALAVTMNRLADGASYAAQTLLDAPKKNIRVVVENTGHRPL